MTNITKTVRKKMVAKRKIEDKGTKTKKKERDRENDVEEGEKRG